MVIIMLSVRKVVVVKMVIFNLVGFWSVKIFISEIVRIEKSVRLESYVKIY